MPHNNLTIDFNDASFDEANTDVQGPGGVDVDVVFPISDDVNFAVSRADNRPGSENSVGVGTGTASAIALMPDQATANLMDEFLFEFENDIDPSDAAKNDQGLKVTFKGYDTNQNREVLSDINITGSFENLHDGGTLDLHIDRGTHNGQSIVESITLGAPENDSGNQNAILVSGDNGANLGAGNDVVEINVDASADMTGIYQGGSGTDVLKLIEGLPENNGAIVDFGGSIPGDENSAFITNFGGEGSGLNFYATGWETIELTNAADLVIIEDGVGNGLTTRFDTAYQNGGLSNSMIEIKTGFTDGGLKDVLKVDADSNLYLNFDFLHQNIELDASNKGVQAVFKSNGDVTVNDYHGSGATVDVFVEKTAGSGMTVDYLELTGNADIVTNEGTIGVTVDLGGSKGAYDIFTGSANSANDVLDARAVNDLTFEKVMHQTEHYIQVTSGTDVHARLKDVDYIMVRDRAGQGPEVTPADVAAYQKLVNDEATAQNLLDAATPVTSGDVAAYQKLVNDEATAQSLLNAATRPVLTDVDFLKDMSHLNNTYVIDNLGSGATDEYGKGYDVMTSAIVDTFGTGSNLRVYYEGDHDDFIDTDDIMHGTEGVLTMSSGLSSRGSTWESDIESSNEYDKGQAPGFYIEIINAQDPTDKDKLAVTFDDVKGMWKVDTTAVQVAEGATSAISAASTSVPLGNSMAQSAITGENLAFVVADRFGIQLDMSAGVDHTGTTISGDIYLNATEEAITQLLGSGVEEKAYDFGFYTKVDLKAVGGDVTVNVNLQQQPGAGNTFKLDFKDLDVSVESFHNVVGVDATPAAGIVSSSAAGEFVHMDSEQDIALGNGGNDTYVVGANASGMYGGTALEYGNIGEYGGLANSDADAVNFNSATSVSDLTFERKAVRNEADGNSLSIKDAGGKETILFDNYNTYLDFRRVEYLTVEDGANNDEVYEIVTNTNLGGWDNEIYVADGGNTAIKLGGQDYIVGSSKADTFTFSLGDIAGGSSDEVATIDLLQLGSGDSITFTDPGTDLSAAEGISLNNLLQASVTSGGQIKFDFDYDYEGENGTDDKLTVTYDSDPSNIAIDQELIFII